MGNVLVIYIFLMIVFYKYISASVSKENLNYTEKHFYFIFLKSITIFNLCTPNMLKNFISDIFFQHKNYKYFFILKDLRRTYQLIH